MGGDQPSWLSAQKASLLRLRDHFQTFPRKSPIIHPSVKSGDWRGEGQRAGPELRPLITDSAAENQGRQTVASATNLCLTTPMTKGLFKEAGRDLQADEPSQHPRHRQSKNTPVCSLPQPHGGREGGELRGSPLTARLEELVQCDPAGAWAP